MSITLQVTFSGSSSPSNSITEVGTAGGYHGSAPDFFSVAAALVSGEYHLQVINITNVPDWGTFVQLTKSDSNPGNVIGTYAEVGGSGTAVVSP